MNGQAASQKATAMATIGTRTKTSGNATVASGFTNGM